MAPLKVVDTIIYNGRVMDPANNIDMTGDVVIRNRKIFEIGQGLESKYAATNTFDANGCIITPGLIDFHVHCYQYATELGINVDECCLRRGVTTVIDAGSAGAGTFAGLRKFIAETSKTKVLAFLHIAAHGLAAAGCSGFGGGGECDSLNQLNVKKCVDCINKNRDLIVGVKVRLSKDISNNGLYEEESYRRALSVAQEVNVPLMTHHTFSTISHGPNDTTSLSCPGDLRPGDIYTHTFHGFPSSTVDPDSMSVRQGVFEAKKRGVLFDVGHGQGSFSWRVAEICIHEGLFPDIISTDLHTGTCLGPAYDLTTVMTKMLSLGMPLFDVVKAVTAVPAKTIKMEHVIGSLSVGHPADVTILKELPCDMEMEDCQSQMRRVKQRLIPIAVWRNGETFEVKLPDPFPNRETIKNQAKFWNDLVVRDNNQSSFS